MYEDLTGRKFGRLTVLRDAGRIKKRHVIWECLCDCGQKTMVITGRLKSGCTRSCGCYQRDRARETQLKHGHSLNKPSSTYQSWRGMKERCLNPKNKAFRWYGKEGIKVCERWLNFENFLADMGERPKGTSLDRIDSSGDYRKENCRWILSTKQQTNTRQNVVLTFNGLSMCIADWARKLNIPYGTLQQRIKKGWTVERALTL